MKSLIAVMLLFAGFGCAQSPESESIPVQNPVGLWREVGGNSQIIFRDNGTASIFIQATCSAEVGSYEVGPGPNGYTLITLSDKSNTSGPLCTDDELLFFMTNNGACAEIGSRIFCR